MAILNRFHLWRFARSRRVGAAGVALSVAVLVACSPSLNWRQSDLQGAGQALFPCRPEHRVRDAVALAGELFTMRQSACEAEGMTFAVTTIRLQARNGTAGIEAERLMDELARSTADNIGAQAAERPPADAASSVTGATRRARLDGTRSDGQPVTVEMAWLVRDGWLLQAAVVGTALQPAAAHAFFEGLEGRL